MLYLSLELLVMLFIILAASILFTNALEHLGYKAGISAGVTGSIFAAVATALPETTVPLVALFAGTSNAAVNEDISVGAILGAPLMISTLSTFLMAVFALKKRGLGGRICPEKVGFVRDLDFFLFAFFLAALAMYLPFHLYYFRMLVSVLLVCVYLVYLSYTFKASKQLVIDGHGVLPDGPLLLTKGGLKNNKKTIALQLVLGLAFLLMGAKGFIQGVEAASRLFHVSALLISLLIIPIATELPEKVNSILWVAKKKDTLAFGNLTGAMIFQGSLLPAIGVLLGSWQPSKEVLCGVAITFLAAAWLRLNASKEGVRISALVINGLLYVSYLYLVVG